MIGSNYDFFNSAVLDHESLFGGHSHGIFKPSASVDLEAKEDSKQGLIGCRQMTIWNSFRH